jgi:multiple sugar transport system substrate-binding protein
MSNRRLRTRRRHTLTRRRRCTTAVVASTVAAALAITACGGSSSSAGGSNGGGSSNGKVHLTMWQQWGGGHEQAELQKVINEYEKLHPNVTITQTPVTNDAKILAAIVGGNPPDILDLGTSLMLGGWAAQGAIMPLDSMIQSSHLNTSVYNPRALEGMKVKGQTYALPFQSFDAALLYNKKLFAQAGLKPPTTFAQLNADAIKLTKRSSSGQITQMGFLPDYPGPDQGQTCPLESYGWLFGGQWTNSSGQSTPYTPQSVAALQWEQSFYKRFGASNVTNFISSSGAYLTSGDPFESGKLAMMFDGPWSEQYAKANNPKLASDVGVVKFPAPSPANDGTTFLDSNPQLIPRGSSNPKAAFDFISWETTNPQVTSMFANTVANIPQLTTVPKFPLENDKLFDLYVNEAKSPQAHVWAENAKASTYSTDLCQAQSGALVGGKTATAALQNLASQLKQQ